MSFANINLGTTAGDHGGDPLRVAFDKINRNFYQITTGNTGVTLVSTVDSVAGRTGNVTLTVADVPGAVSPGQVTAIVLSNLDGYANLDYVNTRLPNVSTVDDTVAAAIDAEDLPAIRTSLGTLQTQITANANDIVSLEAADVVLSSSITGANAAIVTANTAMKNYVDGRDLVLSNNISSAWATANAAVSGSGLTDVINDIAEINANVAGANLDIYWLSNTVNNGLAPSITNLWANLSAANAASIASNTAMKSYVDGLNAVLSANAATQLAQITGANAAIVTANTAMKSYVDVKVGEVADAWLANAAAQATQISNTNAAIATANLALKNYTDSQITSSNAAMQSYVDSSAAAVTAAWSANAAAQLAQITGANAAIVNANIAMKSYVDAGVSGLTANAAGQQASIDSLTANSVAQQTTLNQHTANIAILNDTTVALASAITQINTGSGFATMPQLTANVNAINANVATLAANVAVHTANISFLTGNLATTNENITFIVANLNLLRSNAVTQHTQIFSANSYNIARTNEFNDQMSANIIAANAAITSLTSDLSNLNVDVTNLETAVTGLLVGGIYAYSNSNVASYLPVDSTITSIQSNVTAANSAIITSNTAMKNYVDTQVSANAYSNAKVASYLLTSTGNINGDYINAETRVSTTALYASESIIAGRASAVNAVSPVVALGSVSGSITIDTSAGDSQTLATSGPITISGFSNWPASGVKGSVTLQVLIASTAHTITLPSSVSGLTGTVGYFQTNQTWTAPVTGTYVFTFTSVDAGTNVLVAESNSILRPFNSAAEAITNTGNAIVSLGTTYTTYRTASNGSAFLGNGVAGQIKVLGTSVADTWTVNAASTTWPSSRITFSSPGQSATLVWNSATGQWSVVNIFGSPSFV